MSKNIAQVFAANPITTIGNTDLIYIGQNAATDAAINGLNFKAQFSPLSTKGDIYTFSTVNARLAVGTTNGQILQVNGTTATGLAWSTATYPVTTTINRILYSSSNNVVDQIVTANTSVLTTSGAGVPGFTAYVSTGGTYGGTSNIVARDANGNTAFNNTITAVTNNAAGSSIVLTAASSQGQSFSGVGASTIQLPDATTLLNNYDFYINNNTNNTVTVLLNDGITTLFTLPVGGNVKVILFSNATTNGTWDWHWFFPATAASGTIYMGNGTNAGYKFSTATYPFTTTINQLLYSSAANTITGLATVNDASLTTNATGVPTWIALGAGQVVIGSAIGAPIAATLSAGTGVSIANGNNSITISSNGANPWVDQLSGSVTLAVNTGYTTDNGAALVTYTLPATSAIGDWIEINGKSSGGWTIAQLAGQQIHFGSTPTTVGVAGSISSTNQYDCIRLRCITANTTFVVVSSIGNMTVA